MSRLPHGGTLDGTPRPRATTPAPTDDRPRVVHTLRHIPALDGARALAVLLVMGYHFGIPAGDGGFLGVDLFFVLSGFLITTLLVSEWHNTGRIDLARFWLRRARRLLPALFLLLATVLAVVATDTTIDPGLRRDLAASILYVANWSFLTGHRSYFAEYTDPSPVQHLWSLAIEEQFYLLWPLLVAAALAIRARRARPRRAGAVLLALLAACTLASLTALALRWDAGDPTASYFATDTRAHELLIGAVAAAVVFPRQTAPPTSAAPAAALATWTGLAVVLGLPLVLDDTAAPYYHGGSTLFSLGTACLLVGVSLSHNPVTRVLSHPLAVRTGAISYGLYLWHWPATVWLTPDTTGLHGPALLGLRLTATFTVALASYHLLEMPVRRGYWRGVALGPRRFVPVCVLTAVALLAGTLAATHGKTLPGYLRETSTRTDLTAGARGEDVIGIVGDSVAASLYPGLRERAASRGLGTVAAAFSGCSVGGILRADDTGEPFTNTAWCAGNAPRLQTEMITRYDPGTVLWYSGRERYDLVLGDRLVEAGSAEWVRRVEADWDATLDRLRAGGARVVLVLPIFMAGQVPGRCSVSSYRDPDPCPGGTYLGTGPLRAIYQDWAARHARELTVVDLLDVLCPDSSHACPKKLDGRMIRADSVHYSQDSARWFCDHLLARLPWLPRPAPGSDPAP